MIKFDCSELMDFSINYQQMLLQVIVATWASLREIIRYVTDDDAKKLIAFVTLILCMFFR